MNSMRSSHRWRIALRRATSSASLDMSVAIICVSGAFIAIAIAIAPEPVPISRMRGLRTRREKFQCGLDQSLSLGRGIRTARCHFEIEREEFLAPDDVGDRLRDARRWIIARNFSDSVCVQLCRRGHHRRARGRRKHSRAKLPRRGARYRYPHRQGSGRPLRSTGATSGRFRLRASLDNAARTTIRR